MYALPAELHPHITFEMSQLYADEGTRTPTPKTLDPKSSASTNSATSASYLIKGWMTGLEPATTGATILDSTN